ncbi:hypothetical protein BpHYR1_000097, partial [Brachionus plicatilis]
RDDLEKFLYGSLRITGQIQDIPPNPIRYEVTNTRKIPTFLDQEIKNEDFITQIEDLKKKQFISNLKPKKINEIAQKLKNFYSNSVNSEIKVSNLSQQNKLICLGNNQNDCNIGNEIQIEIDTKKKTIEAKCSLFFEQNNNDKSKSKISKCLNSVKNEATLEPIFIWCNLDHVKESFLLKELKTKLKEENFRVFLFLDTGESINNKPVFCEKIRKFCEKGHILKLMFMITELFNIPIFFYIEDSVTEFQEFNGNEHQSSKDKSSCIRALTFMSKTMRMAINDCDKKDQLSSKFDMRIQRNQNANI